MFLNNAIGIGIIMVFLFLGNVVICNKLMVFHCRAVRNIY